MLTRIEIDGFKTFEGFELDLSPFAVVLGVNSAGKSNLFDAIQLLSNLATKDLRTSAQGLRGDVDELYRQESPGRSASQMRLAVEVLVDPVVRDPWGAEVRLKHTRLRYEVVIERRSGERGTERLLGEVLRRTRIRSVHSHQVEMFAEHRPEVSRFEVQQYLQP